MKKLPINTTKGGSTLFVGDVYDNNYKVIRKLGFGAYSTIWLANDIRYRNSDLIFKLMCPEMTALLR
jgi:hypothetical protein